jgi:hypothetical protein
MNAIHASAAEWMAANKNQKNQNFFFCLRGALLASLERH